MERYKLLEFYAGSRSIGKEAEHLGMEVFSTDINAFEKIDYVVDIMNFDRNKVPFIPDIVWGSPPCTFFSVASIGHHWNKDHTPKSANAIKGMAIVKATLDLINYYLSLNPNLIWYLENPRGKLRKLSIMEGLERTTVMYCQYGDDRMKPTDIWSNNLKSLINPDGFEAKTCFNGNKNCHHEAAPRGSKTGTQGRRGGYDRSKILAELCRQILISSINNL